MGFELCPHTFPELQGCKAFGYVISFWIQEKSYLHRRHDTPSQKQIREFRQLVEQISNIPASALIITGIHEGRAVLRGYIHACDRSSYYALRRLINRVCRDIQALAKQRNIMSCLVLFKQQIKFKNIEY